MAVADFHAHLAHTEVIGYFGGHWDPVRKGGFAAGVRHVCAAYINGRAHFILWPCCPAVDIVMAYPCRSLERQGLDGMDRDIDVEMDPESEMEVRSAIHDADVRLPSSYGHTAMLSI